MHENETQSLSDPDKKCWVNWRLVHRNGEEKATKVPFMPSGSGASSTDPTTWSTYAEVATAKADFDGIGIVFDGQLLGIDLDHCIAENGTVPTEIAALIESAKTYTEVSPSGKGLHLYLRLTEPLELERNRSGSYECYTTGRYFTVTGNAYTESYPIRSVNSEEAIELLTVIGYPWKKKEEVATAVAVAESTPLEDAEVLTRMFAAKNGAKVRALYDGDISAYEGDDSSADAALCAHLAFWTNNNAAQMKSLWLASPLGARAKTQERADYQKRTIENAISITKETVGSSNNTEEAVQSTQSTRLLQLVINNPDVTLFLDQYKTAYIRFPREDHFEVWPCASSEFRYWLSDEAYKASKGAVPSSKVIADVLNVLHSRARSGGLSYTLNNRIAEQDEGVMWYDMCDTEWRAIRIDADGWKIVTEPPILFRRHTYHEAQVIPVAGGDIHEMLQFVNVKDANQQRLYLAHLVASFIPGFDHAILYVHGPAGSAKSTLIENTGALVDPSSIGTLSLTKKIEDLKQTLNHHSAFAAFDNVSDINQEVSDLICRAVTGAGFSKRSHYTNDEDFIFRVRANVAINGINLGCTYQDLLDRSLLMELERIDNTNRKEAKKLQSKFMEARPQLVGAILDLMVKAIRIKPTIELESLNRMGSYEAWGCAITEAMGEPRELYLSAFQKNVNGQNEAVLDSSDVAALLFALMDSVEEWEGTKTALLGKLHELAESLLIDVKTLPKNGAALSRSLNVLKPSLESAGLRFSDGTRSKERSIIIRKVIKTTTESVDGVDQGAVLLEEDSSSEEGNVSHV